MIRRSLVWAQVLAMMTSLWVAGDLRALPHAGDDVRVERVLRDGWRFIRDDVAGAEREALDDSAWQAVSVPHTWNAGDGADGGNDYYRGPAWYRLRLPVEEALTGRSLFLRFGAASTVADVYVNGLHVGQHKGGFSAFCFDVTPHLRTGADNVVAVRVTNALDPDVTPISGDFTIYGGLYRDVHLLALGPLSISPLDDAGPGVYLRATSITKESATIEATVKLRNGSDAPARATVTCTVSDADDRVVATGSTEQQVAARSTADAPLHVKLPSPRRWDGRRDPYAYRVTSDVRDEGGRLLDRVVQPLGVRTFRVDPRQGLILNDAPYALHGVNYHQGNLTRGWADSREDKQRDFKLIEDTGCSGVRLAHYQHDPYDYALCDRIGLVVWAELGLVDKLTDSPAFFENAKQQLRELIKQNYNHPSILFWSLYNEPRIDRERGEHEWRLIDELNHLAHQLDPLRLTTGAVVAGPEPRLNWVMDVTAFNRYWGWYTGDAEDWPAKLEELRRGAGGRSFGIAEYGAGASATHHELDVQRPRHNGAWHPEQWQAHVHETIWPALDERPWIWCKFIWVMFDFASDSRREGGRAGVNDKGLVTGDRSALKDAYFFYQANWSREPLVHITSKRFAVRPVGRAEVKVYSNCDEVELLVNGRSLGHKRSANRVFVWTDVPFEAGQVSARALGTSDGRQYEDACVWTVAQGAPARHSTTAPISPTTAPAR